MRACIPFLLGALLGAQSPAIDPAKTLDALVQEALGAHPDLKALEAQALLARERVPQATALADPVLSLGYQNDGFGKLQYGKMETTLATIMGSQALPWPGKRALRRDVADLEVWKAEAALKRARLDVASDLWNAYLGWAQAEGQRRLLEEQEGIFAQAEALAQVRYEVGQAPQTDLLRAQLERTRLQQRRLALAVETPRFVQELNRLRGKAPDAPLEPPPPLEAWPREARPELDRALLEADVHSPDLLLARLGIRQSRARIALAERELRPDLAVSAGVMPRGALEPMWSVGLSVSLPIFSGSKQRRAVAEHRAHHQSESSSEEGLKRLLDQRVRERLQAWEGADRILALYEGGLLAQGEATVQSTLGQYEVGRLPFSAVLESLNGLLADRAARLELLAQRQRLIIAHQALSLEPTPALGSGAAMGTPSLGSAPLRTPSRMTGPAPGLPAASPASTPMSGM